MLSFSHVTKIYGKRKKRRMAVDDFSLDVKAPIFGFLGQNGAGKTTIVKMVTGLLAPTSGTITIDGASSASPESKQKMGFMPETPYFYENMTGIEFMRFCAELFRVGDRETHSWRACSRRPASRARAIMRSIRIRRECASGSASPNP